MLIKKVLTFNQTYYNNNTIKIKNDKCNQMYLNVFLHLITSNYI